MEYKKISAVTFNSPEEYFNYELDRQVKKAISGYETELAKSRDNNENSERKIHELEAKFKNLDTDANIREKVGSFSLGLTRREYFIGQALSGILSGERIMYSHKLIAEEAIVVGTRVAELLANEDQVCNKDRNMIDEKLNNNDRR